MNSDNEAKFTRLWKLQTSLNTLLLSDSRDVNVVIAKLQAMISHTDVLERSIDTLGLTVRSKNCCDTAKVYLIGDLVQQTETAVETWHNAGHTVVADINLKLSPHQLRLGMVLTETQKALIIVIQSFVQK